MQIKLPSGLSGEVRKLKGTEVNLFTDKAALKKGDLFDRILAACWEKTTEKGPYPFVEEGDSPVPWDRILVGDRTVALIAIRVASYGTQYIFPVQCNNNQVCGERFEWEIDLSSDLPVYDYPPNVLEKLRDGENEFEVSVGEHTVTFKLLNGKDELINGRRLSKNRSEILSVGLAARLLSVDEKAVNQTRAEQFIKSMDASDQWDLLRSFEAFEGGVDQVVEIECPECQTKQEINLPLEGDGFWIPSSRKQRKKVRAETRKGQKRTLFGTTESEDDETTGRED